MKMFEDQMRVGDRPWNQLLQRGAWTEGRVVTRHGIVSVYAQGDDQHHHVSQVRIVRDGVLYSRQVDGKRYTPRGLVTLASRFAAEIFASEAPVREAEADSEGDGK